MFTCAGRVVPVCGPAHCHLGLCWASSSTIKPEGHKHRGTAEPLLRTTDTSSSASGAAPGLLLCAGPPPSHSAAPPFLLPTMPNEPCLARHGNIRVMLIRWAGCESKHGTDTRTVPAWSNCSVSHTMSKPDQQYHTLGRPRRHAPSCHLYEQALQRTNTHEIHLLRRSTVEVHV